MFRNLDASDRELAVSKLVRESAEAFAKEKEKEILLLKKEQELQDAIVNEQKAKINANRNRLIFISFGGLLMLILAFVSFRAYHQKRKDNEIIIKQKDEVEKQKDEITAQRDEIETQRDHVMQQKQEITDSINYAQIIQRAVLPEEELITKALPDHFILFKPRDIVSGDFYWFKQIKNHAVIVAADCTGHGVPGAFMSMLGISFLNEIVSKSRFDSAGEILNRLRHKVKTSLKQRGEKGESKDGMDIALCIVDLEYNMLQYAGAYNPLLIVRPNGEQPELIEVKANRQPIAIHMKEEDFKTNEIQLQKDDTFYIFSDGYIDQFGGEKGQKFKTKHFKNLLLSINDKSIAEQKEILDETIESWRSNPGINGVPHEQVDDILVVGVRI
jgi:serine phosphatase RsbU (regulator of sigma subunit)